MNILERLVKKALLTLARSLENPNTPLTAEQLSKLLYPDSNSSGVVVNMDSALKLSAVWRGANIISGSVGKIPILIYRKNGRNKERDTDHPAYDLLRYQPNKLMTAKPFKEAVQLMAIMKGNGYAMIERDGTFKPTALIPLDPDRVTPVRVGGEVEYIYRTSDGPGARIPAWNMIHIKGLGFDGLTGKGIVEFGSEVLGYAKAAHDHGARFFSNSASPGVVIECPNGMSEEAYKRLKESWDRLHRGVSKAHGTAILEEGAKLAKYSFNAQEAQLIDNVKFSIIEIANLLGIPPHKLGDSSRTAYNSLESENQSFLDDTLDPWLVSWEEELRSKILTEADKSADLYTVEFLRQVMLRANMNDRGAYYQKAIASGAWMTVNEVRALENMNAVEGGDEIVQPSNNFSPKAAEPAADSKSSRSCDMEAVLAAFGALEDVKARMRKRLLVHAAKAKAASPADLESKLEADHSEIVRRALEPAAKVREALTGEKNLAETITKELIEEIKNALQK